MVGDTFDADHVGARRAGMRSILVTAEHGPQDRVESVEVQPDAVARDLHDVAVIVEGWS